MLYDLAERLATRQQGFAVILEPDAPPRRAIEVSGVEPAAWLHADQAAALAALGGGPSAAAACRRAAPSRPCDMSTISSQLQRGAQRRAQLCLVRRALSVDAAQPRRGAHAGRRAVAQQPLPDQRRGASRYTIVSSMPSIAIRRTPAGGSVIASQLRAVALGHLVPAAPVEAYRG